MKKLIALLLLSPLAFAEDWNYLICKPKSLLGNSHSYEFNAFIKYFPRPNKGGVTEYPSQFPYTPDSKIRSVDGIQVKQIEASPSDSQEDPDNVWEFKTWEFFAIKKPEEYIAPGGNQGPMFNLNRKTLELVYRPERYGLFDNTWHYEDKKKCHVVSGEVFNNSLDEAKIKRLKRNQKFLEKHNNEIKI